MLSCHFNGRSTITSERNNCQFTRVMRLSTEKISEPHDARGSPKHNFLHCMPVTETCGISHNAALCCCRNFHLLMPPEKNDKICLLIGCLCYQQGKIQHIFLSKWERRLAKTTDTPVVPYIKGLSWRRFVRGWRVRPASARSVQRAKK